MNSCKSYVKNCKYPTLIFSTLAFQNTQWTNEWTNGSSFHQAFTETQPEKSQHKRRTSCAKQLPDLSKPHE